MSIQQIIEDLKEMGETEAAMKLLLMSSGLIERNHRVSHSAKQIIELFPWKSTEEGYRYWAKLNSKLIDYRRQRRLQGLIQEAKI